MHASGQHIIQYALVLSLVVLASVPALGFFSNQINLLYFENDVHSRGSQIFSLLEPRAKSNVPPNSMNGTLSDDSPLLMPSGDRIQQYSDLQKIYPDNTFIGSMTTSAQGMNTLAEMIGKNGGGGATAKLASEMDTLINNLEASGDINSAGIAELRALASQGRRIASIESLLETAARNANYDTTLLNASPISFEGGVYTPKELASIIAWDLTPQEFTGKLVETTGAGSEMAAFQAHYQTAMANPGLKNSPIAQQIISVLSEEIAIMAEAVEHSVSDLSLGELQGGEAFMNEVVTTTRTNSSTIDYLGQQTEATGSAP